MKTMLKIIPHFFFCFITLFFLYKNRPADSNLIVFGILLSGIAIGYYFVREKAQNFWVFLFFHLIGIGAFIVVISFGGFIRNIGMLAIGVILYSIVIRYFPKDLEKPQYFHLLYFVLAYYVVPAFQVWIVYMVIAYFLLTLLYSNLKSLEFYILTRSLTTSVDEQEVSKNNRVVTIIYVGLLGLILCLVSAVQSNRIWEAIGRILKIMIRFLAGVFAKEEAEVLPEEPKEEENGAMMPMLPDETVQNARIFEIISDIIQVVALIALVAGAIYFIVKVLIKLYHHFYASQTVDDVSVTVERLSATERKVRQNKTKMRTRDGKMTNRIRRYYKNYLKKMGAKKTPKIHFLTPTDQLEQMCMQTCDEHTKERICSLYEKARYSGQEMSGEEVVLFKNILQERNLEK